MTAAEQRKAARAAYMRNYAAKNRQRLRIYHREYARATYRKNGAHIRAYESGRQRAKREQARRARLEHLSGLQNLSLRQVCEWLRLKENLSNPTASRFGELFRSIQL